MLCVGFLVSTCMAMEFQDKIPPNIYPRQKAPAQNPQRQTQPGQTPQSKFFVFQFLKFSWFLMCITY